jgi:hypothetical protein
MLCRLKPIKTFLKSTTRTLTDMSEKSFWDKFYQSKEKQREFEWLIEYDKAIITSLIDFKQFKSGINLDIGVGLSKFSIKLFEDINKPNYLLLADFSSTALNTLKNDVKSTKLNHDFLICDCNHLPIRNDCLTLILDKGYLDSVLKSKDQPIDKAFLSFYNLMLKLEHSNILMQITDEEPELRFDLLEKFKQKSGLNYSCSFKEIILSNDQAYYIYFISKNLK